MLVKTININELEKLLLIVLQKYPELEDYSFTIKYNSLDKAYAEYAIEDKNVDIEIDNNLKNKDNALKIGVIAHELSHIIKEKKLSIFPIGLGRYIDEKLYEKIKIYKKFDERQADIEAVKRGFGKELLELIKYDNIDAENIEDSGLSTNELESMLEMETMRRRFIKKLLGKR